MTQDEKMWYKKNYRRILVDMHIPDWNEEFLSKYEPKKMVEFYERAGVTSVMFYCQSHVGLCYWPTKVGRMHAGLKGRDIVRELLDELKKRNLSACGYYSLIYNNWAFLEHPEWRIVPAGDTSDGSFAGHRYGHCCPNNPEYKKFCLAQTDELVTSYDLDGLFYDMTFWPAICLCDHCRAKFRKETGLDIPKTINWFSPDWCRFQAARERWISEFAGELSARVKSQKPQMSVYHNFATAMFNWTLGLGFDSVKHHDFLGADFYGDSLEQLIVSKLMLNLSPGKPMEFMTSCCVNLRDHVRLKKTDVMETQALASTLFSSAFLFIDAVNIDGTVNSATSDRIAEIYKTTAPYEPYLGGDAIEDIGVYFSSDSKMDFAENGIMLKDAPLWGNDFPHIRSIRGICRVLQQHHLPFGIVTRKQLNALNRYKLIVLPNVLRMNEEEVSAIREYVRQGGKLYASRYTSLTQTSGICHTDFMLADVFGCHYQAENPSRVNYLDPAINELKSVIYPQSCISHFPISPNDAEIGTLLLDETTQGKILATLMRPYAVPERGTVFDQNWASIHSSPPWKNTLRPVIVENHFGEGKAIYSAADIEAVASDVNDRFLLQIIRLLVDEPFSCTADAHPCVWMNVCHEPESKKFNLGFLNYPSEFPALPIPVIDFTIRPPAGNRFVRLVERPSGIPVAFTLNESGTLSAKIKNLKLFILLEAQYS
jgi:hypothetical protein